MLGLTRDEYLADNDRRASHLEKACMGSLTRDGALWEVEEGSTRRGLILRKKHSREAWGVYWEGWNVRK